MPLRAGTGPVLAHNGMFIEERAIRLIINSIFSLVSISDNHHAYHIQIENEERACIK